MGDPLEDYSNSVKILSLCLESTSSVLVVFSPCFYLKDDDSLVDWSPVYSLPLSTVFLWLPGFSGVGQTALLRWTHSDVIIQLLTSGRKQSHWSWWLFTTCRALLFVSCTHPTLISIATSVKPLLVSAAILCAQPTPPHPTPPYPSLPTPPLWYVDTSGSD